MVCKLNHNQKDIVVDNIYAVLKNSPGLTITDIVEKADFSRSAVRTALAKLDGAEKVLIRKIGMAKVYFIKNGKNKGWQND